VARRGVHAAVGLIAPALVPVYTLDKGVTNLKDGSMIGRISPVVAGIALFISVAFRFPALTAYAQPSITEATPAHGEVLATLPESFRLCFSEPVKVENASDWAFNVTTPEGRDLGLRIVFDTGGNCVDVFPGVPDEPPEGIWAFDWLVRAQADDSEGSGSINFQLGALQPDETPIETPDATETGQPNDDDGVPLGLYVAAGVGIVVILAAGAGFALSRRRRA
jgi:methionine-rich copper-binding protein CopC